MKAVVETNASATALQLIDAPVLVGREQELGECKKILADGQPLLMVITGGPRVGKKSLLHAFRAEAEAVGWNTAPSSTASDALRVTPLTNEESFSTQVQALIAMPSDKSFIEKSPAKSPAETPAAQQLLLPIVEQLRTRARLLLLIDGYRPEPGFMDWFEQRFVPDLMRSGAPIIVAVSERPEGAEKLSPLAKLTITLAPLEEQAIRQHFEKLGEQLSPPMKEDELKVLVETACAKIEMIVSLTRVLRLAKSV